MPKWCIYFMQEEEIDVLASWFEIPDNPIGAAIMRPHNVTTIPPKRRRNRQARPESERTLIDFF